ATWWDYDGDGWPDLYVANDFAQPDRLYRNNRDGTFTDVIDSVVPHMPYSSMGSDLGDVDNDGRVDFLVADMAATTHQKDQRTVAVMRAFPNIRIDPPDSSASAPQYMRNALYLNGGVGRMREAAEMAGLSATDWTWSVRFEDLDHDGRIDLFVTNGMNRESHNADLTSRKELAETPDMKIRIERQSPVLAERHLAYRNLGGLRFEEVGKAWGLDQRGVGFGAAFGDLDGDGDMDLVYSNYQGNVSVLRNDIDSGHSVIVALRGVLSNRYGVGSMVRVETAAGAQVRPLVLARGVLSSSEPVLHFGLGEDTRILRLTVSWPSGHEQVFTDLGVDRRFTVTEPGSPAHPAAAAAPAAGQFSDISASVNFSLESRELSVDELVQQPLLPFRQNRRGPGIAVADLDGSGRDAVLLCGTPQAQARLLLPVPGRGFAPGDSSGFAADGPLSDGPALFMDVGGDGRMDALVTRGGSALPAGAAEYQPRLLMNDGRGGFRAAGEGALPALGISAGAAAAADFDR
ncbi:MAG TPA: CRTAC1 family protein, partial [Opitutaceae bacterium]